MQLANYDLPQCVQAVCRERIQVCGWQAKKWQAQSRQACRKVEGFSAPAEDFVAMGWLQPASSMLYHREGLQHQGEPIITAQVLHKEWY